MNKTPPQYMYWNEAAKSKEFHDPFYLNQLEKHIQQDAVIVEYGCGYGRIINFLHEHHYHDVTGYDFSSAMIERGKIKFSHLNLHHINHASLPLVDHSVDCIIMSTVLCCIPDHESQQEVMSEISRVLKPGGIFYLTDFLITASDHMTAKYNSGYEQYRTFGIYKTTEGAIVRHYTADYIQYLLQDFETLWYQEEAFVTMNNNPVNSFHGIFKLKSC